MAGRAGVADPNAGMGIASGDFDGDGRPDLFVTNARGQGHAAYRGRSGRRPAPRSSTCARSWGPTSPVRPGGASSFADLDLDTDLDLLYVNGAVPVTDLEADAEPIRVLLNDGVAAFEAGRGRRRRAAGGAGQRSGRLRQRRRPRRGRQRRSAAASSCSRTASVGATGWRSTLDGGRARHPGDRHARGRAHDGARGRRRQQLPLLGGPARCTSGSATPPSTRSTSVGPTATRPTSTRWTSTGSSRSGARVRRALAAALAATIAVGGLASCSGVGARRYVVEGCEPVDREGRSVARVWDEALLDAIRRDVPAPTVHARNLFHTSAAMWDAWAAYDPEADGYLVDREARGRPGGDLRPPARRRSASPPTGSSCGATREPPASRRPSTSSRRPWRASATRRTSSTRSGARPPPSATGSPPR